MVNIEEYKRKRKLKDVPKEENNFFKNLIIKVLVCLVLFLCFLIGIKKIEGFDKIIYNNVYNSNISFAMLNSWYNEHFGSLFLDDEIKKDVVVFNDSIVYSSKKDYLDGVELSVSDNYLVPILKDGIVVFIGEKDNYGSVVIVEDEEGLDTWYCNVSVGNINMYDYVKQGDYIGEVKENRLILVFQKKGQIEDYKKYI